jgi:hypothetical protein
MLAAPASPLLVPFTLAPGLALVVAWDGGPVAEVSPPGEPERLVERWRMTDSTGEPLIGFNEADLRIVAEYRATLPAPARLH